MSSKPRMSRHHRKCKSLGGTNAFENLVVIPMKEHRAWHLIFDNKPAPQIAGIINAHYIDPTMELCVVDIVSGEQVDVDYRAVTEPTTKHWSAWQTLFNHQGIGYVCTMINEIYLDPDYQFFIRRRR